MSDLTHSTIRLPFSKHIRTFCGANSEGNSHHVIVDILPPDELITHTHTRDNNTDEILVAVQAPHLVGNATNLRFMQFGQPISRCGSGNIAASWALNACGITASSAVSSCERVALVQQQALFGYQSFSLPIALHKIPFPIQHCLGLHTDIVYRCGDDADYLIAVYANEQQIKSLRPKSSNICQTTTRAIIATAPSRQSGFDYCLRYFAPQWGNPEDPATGSANTMLAPYWAQSLKKQTLHAMQLSKAGGEMMLQVQPEAAGNTAIGPTKVTVLGMCQEIA